MIVKVKLFAMLKKHLPEGTKGETMELEMPEGATPQQVIDRLEIPKGMAHLAMLDGYHLLPDERTGRSIKPGETLAIFPPIAGGN